ncbi:MAG TPA: hypothetical protein V6D19_08580 [Stenomitos sp.]
MSLNSTIQLIIDLNDPNFEPEECEEQTQRLFAALQDMEDVEVHRVLDANPPEGNKSMGGFLVGLLKAEGSVENFKKLMGFLGDRIGSKPIKLKLKAPDGRELELEASSQAEFEFAFQKAQEFLGVK